MDPEADEAGRPVGHCGHAVSARAGERAARHDVCPTAGWLRAPATTRSGCGTPTPAPRAVGSKATPAGSRRWRCCPTEIPLGVRDRRPQARRPLGNPVGLQHGSRRGDKRGGTLRPGAGLHLRLGAGPISLALGSLLGRHGQAHHRRHPRDGPRSKGRPSRGHAAFDAGSHRQGRTARGAPGLVHQ